MFKSLIAGAFLVLSVSHAAAAVVCFSLETSIDGTFKLFARASQGDNYGIASYGVDLVGATNIQHVSPSAFFAFDAQLVGGPAGFSFLRSQDGSPSIAASQNHVGPTPSPHLIRGFGQTPGSFAALGLTPIGPVESPAWAGRLLIATGSYDVQNPFSPAINAASVNTLARVFTSASGTQAEDAQVRVVRPPLTPPDGDECPCCVPEPPALALLATSVIGLSAFAARRRRET